MSKKKIKVPAAPEFKPTGDLDVDMLTAIIQAERLLHLQPYDSTDPSETPEMLAVQVLMQHVPAIGRMCLAGGMVSAGLALPLSVVLEATWTVDQRFALARSLVETINAAQDAATEQPSTEQP